LWHTRQRNAAGNRAEAHCESMDKGVQFHVFQPWRQASVIDRGTGATSATSCWMAALLGGQHADGHIRRPVRYKTKSPVT